MKRLPIRSNGDRRKVLVLTLIVAGVIAGAAYATHDYPTQRPPTYAPNGYLVSNNRVENVSIADFARAMNPDGARFIILHTVRAPGYVGEWISHRGIVFSLVVDGSSTFEYARGGKCVTRTFAAGQGWQKPFEQATRLSAPTGANIYTIYILSEDSHSQSEPAEAPPACS